MATKRSAKGTNITTRAGFLRNMWFSLWDNDQVSDALKDNPIKSTVIKDTIDNLLANVFKGLVTVDDSTFLVLQGGTITVNGSTYTVNEVGYALFGGEIYKINTGSDVLADTIRLVLSSTEDGLYRTLDIEDGTSGSGVVDYADIVYLSDKLQYEYTNQRLTVDGDLTTENLITGQQFDVTDITDDSKSLDTTTQGPTVGQGLFFKTDGTACYVCSSNDDTIYQYTLSTPWDISTASYASKSFSVNSEDGGPNEIYIKSDGLTMFVVGTVNDTVYQYTLGTAWDISTASYASKSFDVSSETTNPSGLFFKTDGTIMYVSDITASPSTRVYQYTLSTAWDVSTASYASKEMDISDTNSGQGMYVLSDGLRVLIASSSSVYMYRLSTAWDISTGSYTGAYYVVGSGLAHGLFVSESADKMYVYSLNTPTVRQYSMLPISEFLESLRTVKIYATDSIVVGDPTNGNKGAGTINAEAVYDDNTLLTDYVFELFFNGKSQDIIPDWYQYRSLKNELEYVRENLSLSTMPTREKWREGKLSLGQLVSRLWAFSENTFLHNIEQQRQIDDLEKRIRKLEK